MRIVLNTFLFFFIISVYSQGKIVVNITNLSSNNGQIVVQLYQKGQEFGMSEIPYRLVYFDSILNNKASFSIADLTVGEYAFLVFHDENKDNKFATNWLGIPKEGIGKSGKQGKRPTYENSKFVVTKQQLNIDIKMKYLL